MESRVQFLGHSVHQMLIVFPFGLLATGVIFDVIRLITGNPLWSTVAFYMIVAGIIGGAVAAIFGFADYTGIPDGTRAKHIGALHGIGNAVVLLLFIGSWYLRLPSRDAPQALAYVLSFVGFGLAAVTGWLGGELVDRLGVGVDANANADAPSSLSHRTA